jgi:hypothetical protein
MMNDIVKALILKLLMEVICHLVRLVYHNWVPLRHLICKLKELFLR